VSMELQRHQLSIELQQWISDYLCGRCTRTQLADWASSRLRAIPNLQLEATPLGELIEYIFGVLKLMLQHSRSLPFRAGVNTPRRRHIHPKHPQQHPQNTTNTASNTHQPSQPKRTQPTQHHIYSPTPPHTASFRHFIPTHPTTPEPAIYTNCAAKVRECTGLESPLTPTLSPFDKGGEGREWGGFCTRRNL
jgi:hypothetical protein